MISKITKLENTRRSWKTFQDFNKRRAFNKSVGPGKNPKLINVGPTFIPDCRVEHQSTFFAEAGLLVFAAKVAKDW